MQMSHRGHAPVARSRRERIDDGDSPDSSRGKSRPIVAPILAATKHADGVHAGWWIVRGCGRRASHCCS